MDRIWELKISSSSDIRQAVARLQYELLEANKCGKELVIEIWKENHEPKMADYIIESGQKRDQANGFVYDSDMAGVN